VNHAWLTLNAATGELTGTPTATGNTVITVKAVDDANALDTAQKTFHIEIKNVAITTAVLAGAYQDLAYSQTVAAMGGATPYAWSLRPGGENYAWLAIDALTGELTGTPTSAELGNVKVIVRVDDNGGNYDIRLFTFSVRVYDPPVMTATTLPDGLANEAYSAFVPVTGGAGGLTYSITSGTNHDWLDIDTATGELTGTPDLSEAGAVTVAVKVEEADNPTVFVEGTLVFTVLGLQITTALLPDIATGGTYGMTIEAKGGSGYYAWSVNDGASANHGWLTLDMDHGGLTGSAPGTVQEVVLAVDVEDSLDPTLTHSATFRFFTVGSILAEGFESGIPGTWSAAGGWFSVTPVATAVGPYPAAEGTMAARCTNWTLYGNNIAWDTCTLDTLSFNIPASTERIVLTFEHWFLCEPGDGGILQIDPGTGSFVNLTPEDDLPGKVDPLGANLDGYTGTAVGEWRTAVYDLTSYQNTANVILRWNFFSDATMAGRGWYIDDVHLFEMPGSANPSTVSAVFPRNTSAYAPPDPGDYATSFTLRWTASVGADSGYEVFAGTNLAAVEAATTASVEHLGTAATPSYTDTLGTFSVGNLYYWRVDAVNTNGTTKGEVWSFTAASATAAILLNEVQTLAWWPQTRPQFVEIHNRSGTDQNLTGWTLDIYNGGAIAGTYTFPATVLPARQSLAILTGPASGVGWLPYVGNRVHTAWFPFGWTNGLSEGEVALFDANLGGVDYMGFNVVTSHLPAGLLWSGTLLGNTSWWLSDFHRTSTSDTDTASDWALQSYVFATPNAKNQGQ
jgi:hypothetical protein